MADLVASDRSEQKESCPKNRGVGSSPEQKWSLQQEWGPALQAAHPSHDRLRVPYRQVRCKHPHLEAAGNAVRFRFATGALW